ncbi:hypothetical protein QTH97_32470 [Variovorax sp. J22R24]|uniref:exodeoxyribonuclease VII small subunit n=1 Tax=Variovorax gracilis TaxID=3053502 RepID=UPI0025760732|nr:exodeoxyribonuclease VII small subunit [Variovorax sp. J22R24]MDM0109674.1 hypothetical protein [Variovorax sp. J22R24]
MREITGEGPDKTLNRGFAIVRDTIGEPITGLAGSRQTSTSRSSSATAARVRGPASGFKAPTSNNRPLRAAYDVLQKHAETLHEQNEPNIDDLPKIVTESVGAYKVCTKRFDAVEEDLKAALEGTGVESST